VARISDRVFAVLAGLLFELARFTFEVDRDEPDLRRSGSAAGE
jgi:hypothetical protein